QLAARGGSPRAFSPPTYYYPLYKEQAHIRRQREGVFLPYSKLLLLTVYSLTYTPSAQLLFLQLKFPSDFHKKQVTTHIQLFMLSGYHYRRNMPKCRATPAYRTYLLVMSYG